MLPLDLKTSIFAPLSLECASTRNYRRTAKYHPTYPHTKSSYRYRLRICANICRSALDDAFTVERVASGAQVVAAIAALNPAVVVLDLQIGNMGGMAACLAIRQEEEMGRLDPRPVVMLLDRAADEFLARRASADAYLLKPLDPLTLTRTVNNLM